MEKSLQPHSVFGTATAINCLGFYFFVKTNIPQTTLQKCHSSCLRLLIVIVNNATYDYNVNEWHYGNGLDKICQIIHFKKQDVITQLIILHNDGYIELLSHLEMVQDEYILCKVNIPLIYK